MHCKLVFMNTFSIWHPCVAEGVMMVHDVIPSPAGSNITPSITFQLLVVVLTYVYRNMFSIYYFLSIFITNLTQQQAATTKTIAAILFQLFHCSRPFPQMLSQNIICPFLGRKVSCE